MQWRCGVAQSLLRCTHVHNLSFAALITDLDSAGTLQVFEGGDVVAAVLQGCCNPALPSVLLCH